MSYPKLTPLTVSGGTFPRYIAERFSDSLNVKDFGAKGDGVADDTQSIQAAIDAATVITEVISENKINLVTRSVYLPAGRYKVTSTIYVKEGVALIGASQSSTVIVLTHSGVGIQLGGSEKAAYSQIKLISLAIKGNANTTEGVHVEKCYFDSYIDNCHIYNCNINIHIYNSWVFSIYRSFIHNAVSCNIKTNNSTSARICYNRIEYADVNVWFYESDTTGANNGTVGLDFTGNSLQSSQENGILIEHYVSQLAIKECFFERNCISKTAASDDMADINIKTPSSGTNCNCIIEGCYFTEGGLFNSAIATAIKCESAQSMYLVGNKNYNNKYLHFFLATNYDDIEDLTYSQNITTTEFKNECGRLSSKTHFMLKKFTAYEVGDTFSSEKTLSDIDCTDKNGRLITKIRSAVNSNGSARMHLYAYNITGDYKLATLSLINAGTSTNYAIFNGDFRPQATETFNLGVSNYKWANLYCQNGPWSGSDQRLKDNIEDVPEALLKAWGKIRYKVFQMKSSVEKKGDAARIHVGIVAQDVDKAFKEEGIDANRFGLFGYDEWSDEFEEKIVVDKEAEYDEYGAETSPAETHVERYKIQEAGNAYSIRYEEALALECAYQRWRLEQLEERVNQLTNNTNN